MASRDDPATVDIGDASSVAPRAPASELDLADRHRLSALVESLTGHDGTAETLGRFRIEALLGEGAFGEVYRALDPDLQRPLALKLLKLDANADAVVRLRKEARAMAALEHADLLTVYEVGTVGDRAFIAMELAPGGTLSTWARQSPRSFEALAAQVEAAARALAAAHDAGFVHRDVKPSNILIGADGRAKVADFGLVHTRPASVDAPSPAASARTTLAGTPAYMAPEQFDGASPTAAADQYALAVTLFELVYGRRPSSHAPALEDIAVPSHRERAPRRVPPWLREVLLRGLRFDPAARYPSMAGFADALAAGRGQRRRRTRAAVVTTALVTAVGLGWALRPDPAPAAQTLPCAARAHDALDPTWSDTAANELVHDLQATNASYAQALADATRARIDVRANSWVDAWAQACDAGPSPATTEATACLDAQRQHLGTLLGSPIDTETLAPMAAALGDALDPSACAQTSTRPTTSAAPQPQGLRQAEVSLARGAFEEAHDAALAVLDAEQAPSARTVVNAGLLAARASMEQDEPAQAEDPAQRALNAALSVGLDVQASDAALLLARAVAQRTAPDEARRWAALAVSLSDRAGRSVRARAEALSVAAQVEGLAHDIPAAAERCDEAMALAATDDEGPTPQARLQCARAWIAAGRVDDARPHLESALADLRTRYGGRHPAVADALMALSGIYDQATRPDQAVAAAEEALSMLREIYGNDDRRLLRALGVGSGMRNRDSNYDGALDLALEAVALARKTLPPGARRYNYALCMAAGFSSGFECGGRTRTLTDDCVAGVRVSEEAGPVSSMSSPIASTNAQGWLFASLVYACLEDEEAQSGALDGLRRYVDEDNVSFELQTMLLAHLATVEQERGQHRQAEEKIRTLLERTRDTQVITLREGMWRTTLAQALAGQGRHTEAKEEAERALPLLEPGHEEAVGPERAWVLEYLAR